MIAAFSTPGEPDTSNNPASLAGQGCERASRRIGQPIRGGIIGFARPAGRPPALSSCGGVFHRQPDKAAHVVGETGEANVQLCSRKPDRSHGKAHETLLRREDMFHGAAHARLACVGDPRALRHRLAVFDRPPCVPILPGNLGGPVLLVVRDAPFADRCFSRDCVALFGRGHDRRVDDLTS